MSTLVADLQSEAWARGVRLVADASSAIEAEVEGTVLTRAVSELVGALIAAAEPGSSLSLVTGLDCPDGSPLGNLKIQISAPEAAGARAAGVADLVQEIAVASGAVVEREPGAAACSWNFTILWPRARAPLALAGARTAVVVDDDVDTQEFLAEILRGQGYRVIAVNDGFDALVVIERHKPDVVLTDIVMPNMNGLDLMARIKQVRADLPVVLFSGYREALARHVAGLPDKILPKPMTREDVRRALDEVLAEPVAT